MASAQTVLETSIEELPLIHRGKVRDVYQVTDNELLMVATDRLSAFDCVLPTPIPRKGEVLTQLSAFWFKKFGKIVDHHFLTAEFDEMPAACDLDWFAWRGEYLEIRQCELCFRRVWFRCCFSFRYIVPLQDLASIT